MKGSIEQEESAPESSKPGEGEVPTNEENKEEEEDTSCCSLRWQKEKRRKFYCEGKKKEISLWLESLWLLPLLW